MDKFETYLNDHLAGSIVAIDLARRRMPGAPNLVRDLEVLVIGVRGKELLWRSLERLGVTTDPPLAELQARARGQIARLEELHGRAVEEELGDR